MCVAVGLFPLSRAVQAVTLPLLLQHLVVLLKYHHVVLYALCELTLEIIWEWEVFAQQGSFTSANGFQRYGAAHGLSLTMLLAHWLYWSAAMLSLPELLSGSLNRRAHVRPSNIEVRALHLSSVPCTSAVDAHARRATSQGQPHPSLRNTLKGWKESLNTIAHAQSLGSSEGEASISRRQPKGAWGAGSKASSSELQSARTPTQSGRSPTGLGRVQASAGSLDEESLATMQQDLDAAYKHV